MTHSVFEEIPKDRQSVHAMQIATATGSVDALYDPYNERLKLFDVTPAQLADSAELFAMIGDSDPQHPYTKVIVYARDGQDFSALGLESEASIWGFFANGDTATLWCKYLSNERAKTVEFHDDERALSIAATKTAIDPVLPKGYTCATATLHEAEIISELMNECFSDYPTPITTEFLRQNMKARTSIFRVARNPEGIPVACAAAEIHHTRQSAELTDCATIESERGNGLTMVLLRALERDLAEEMGITDVYTIARSSEIAMNCSFAKLGYAFTGRLMNNCRMPRGFESMNVWCRDTKSEI